MNIKKLMLSALIGGLLMAVLGRVPLLKWFNLFLFAWVWVGGFLAVWHYRKSEGIETAGEAATVAALSGVFGAILMATFRILAGMIFGSAVGGAIGAAAMEGLNQAAIAAGEAPVSNFGGAGGALGGGGLFGLFSGASAIAGLIKNIIFYPLFGALSGVVSFNLFKEKQPQDIQDVTNFGGQS